ncbi:unnamed protein product [Urochloa decumbens]|uniref:THAP-type domain-containing protein n=1 Tax=Urochloa decumbens TaxID=240449 RepID=A0ABC8X3R5_9POAL
MEKESNMTICLSVKEEAAAAWRDERRRRERTERCCFPVCGDDVGCPPPTTYFNRFKVMPAQKHWICVKNYFSQKCSSVFGKQKVEPVVKDETPKVVKPAVESC